ncbi:hypothetical protein QE152_g27519 [Popillia japonica]|uniref:Uncharacterized protein n=1 Tax=Popillia japonica TaxID=7064 RepID=A0AAW1JV16_POPJA
MPGTRSNTDKFDEISVNVINFLKSEEFCELIKKAVINETQQLQLQIADLKSEIVVLKQSNIELIRLLSNKDFADSKSIVKENNYSKTFQSTVSNADKTNPRLKRQKPEYQKIVCDKDTSSSTVFIDITKNDAMNTQTNVKDIQTSGKNTEPSKMSEWRYNKK